MAVGLVSLALGAAVQQTAALAQERADSRQDDRFVEAVRLIEANYVHKVDPQLLFENAVRGMAANRVPEKDMDEVRTAVRNRFGAQHDRFSEVVGFFQERYTGNVDTELLFKNAMKGMLNGLDPFSDYISEDEIDDFRKATQGKFGGIGIQIGMREGFLSVISPLEGTPAFEAGVLAGDLIVEIDGKSAEGTTLDQAVKLLMGEPGTKVRLKVRHMTGETQEYAITRAIIEVHTVKGVERDKNDQWVYWVDPEKKIAYIRVTSFVPNTLPELKAAIDGLVKDGMKGLILDLRFNPGGILQVAVDLCDLFVSEGVIVQTKGRTIPHWQAPATQRSKYPIFPTVILVNQFSASASEIVSGCFQDHGRAVIVGERTFGKASVQNVIDLGGRRAALKLTTSYYYLPSGRNIHREDKMTDKDAWGVVPDIGVPMTPEEYVAIVKAHQEGETIKHRGKATVTSDDKPVDRQLAHALGYVEANLSGKVTSAADYARKERVRLDKELADSIAKGNEAKAAREHAEREKLEKELAALRAQGDKSAAEQERLAKELEALKRKGEMRTSQAAATGSALGKRWAIVIGIDDYVAMGKLTVCRNDAKALAKTLAESGGCSENRLVVLTDDTTDLQNRPTLATLKRRIEQVASMAGKDESILVYFSGHGIAKDGQVYLVPMDGDADNAVSLAWIRDTLVKSAASSKVVVLDACHAASGTKGVGGIAPSLATEGAGLVMLLSSGADEVSYPDEGGTRSVFSKYLTEGLAGAADANGDGRITSAELFAFVCQRMADWCVKTGKTQKPVLAPAGAKEVPLTGR